MTSQNSADAGAPIADVPVPDASVPDAPVLGVPASAVVAADQANPAFAAATSAASTATTATAATAAGHTEAPLAQASPNQAEHPTQAGRRRRRVVHLGRRWARWMLKGQLGAVKICAARIRPRTPMTRDC